MDVRGETSAECEGVRAGLFLRDAPLFYAIRLSVQIKANQFWPLDACLSFDQSVLPIERNYAIKRTCIDANAIGGELLATHRMATARNGDGQAFSRCRTHDLGKFVSCPRRQKFANASAIEL